MVDLLAGNATMGAAHRANAKTDVRRKARMLSGQAETARKVILTCSDRGSCKRRIEHRFAFIAESRRNTYTSFLLDVIQHKQHKYLVT